MPRRKRTFTRWISYARKKDAEREVKGFSKNRREKVKIAKLKGGLALSGFRTNKRSKYVKVPQRYEVREY